MYYIGSKILWPLQGRPPQTWIPKPERLRGLLYDYTDHTVVVYDQLDHELMWIEKDTGTLIQTALVNTPVDEVLAMCQFMNVCYMLAYEGDGHLAVYTGSLQEGRTTGVMNVTRYNVPYSVPAIPPNWSVWDMTHTPTLQYMRYHPEYCGIFNIGQTLYLLLGVASTVTGIPGELGQYIVEFDLMGFFRNAVKVDFSSPGNRPSQQSAPNGLGVAADWHDGMISMLSRTGRGDYANVMWNLRMVNNALTYERAEYIYGPLPVGSDVIAAGRWFYSLLANRIFKSEIMMIKVVLEDGWPNTQCVDLGTVASGQVTFRRIQIQNISVAQTYKGLTAYTSDPNLLLSLTSSEDRFDYASSIMLSAELKPGDTAYFWVCLIAPTINDERETPVQYYDYIYFRANEAVI